MNRFNLEKAIAAWRRSLEHRQVYDRRDGPERHCQNVYFTAPLDGGV